METTLEEIKTMLSEAFPKHTIMELIETVEKQTIITMVPASRIPSGFKVEPTNTNLPMGYFKFQDTTLEGLKQKAEYLIELFKK